MSESQFEKMCRSMKEKDAENKRLQAEITRLRKESELLRGLLKEALESPRCSSVWEKIQKEVGDE